MTTSTLEVGNLLSVLSAHGIEKRLQSIAGVGRSSVNPVDGSTTVTYDSSKISLSAIQAAIQDCGFHCAGEALPRHVCETPEMSSGSRPGVPAGLTKAAHSHAGMVMKPGSAM